MEKKLASAVTAYTPNEAISPGLAAEIRELATATLGDLAEKVDELLRKATAAAPLLDKEEEVVIITSPPP